MNLSHWVFGSIAGVAALGIAGAALVVALDGDGHDMSGNMAAGAGMMGGMGAMTADMPMEEMMGSSLAHREHMAQRGAASEMMGGSEMAVMHRLMGGMMQAMGPQGDDAGSHNDHHPGIQ